MSLVGDGSGLSCVAEEACRGLPKQLRTDFPSQSRTAGRRAEGILGDTDYRRRFLSFLEESLMICRV